MTRFWDNIFQKYSVKMYSAEGTMYVRETGFAQNKILEYAVMRGPLSQFSP